MRVLRALAATLALASCGAASEGVFPFALGASAELSSIYGPCRAREVAPRGVVRFDHPEGSRFLAVALGAARVPCRDGTIRLEVRRARRIAIEGLVTPIGVGSDTELRAYGIDADGERLELGDTSDVRWTFEGAWTVHQHGCGHIIPHCPAQNAGMARVTRPGRAVVTASFRGLRATATGIAVAP